MILKLVTLATEWLGFFQSRGITARKIKWLQVLVTFKPGDRCIALCQDSDNPDLRDRGYIYWRLLSTDPVTAKEVVLSEKPLISEETDLIEPTLLDELICHIGSLASVYHKPPNAFVEGSHGIHRKHLPIHHGR